jgi:uncharacterized protein YdaU (DUF1376 family)
MPSKADIWMPLYIGDYLADTSHLDAERHGCYLLWMMHYWRKGPLTSNLSDLVSIGRLRGNNASSIAQALLEEFFSMNGDGLWHQKRQDVERAKWQGKRADAVEKAKKAAAGRWGNASSNASSNAPAMLELCPLPLPSPLPSPLSLSPKTKTSPKAQLETLYKLYPRHIGKAAAFKSIDKALKLKTFDELLLAVRAYVRKVTLETTEEQFIPHPATWFNQGRYEDDMTPHPRQNGNGGHYAGKGESTIQALRECLAENPDGIGADGDSAGNEARQGNALTLFAPARNRAH